MLYEDNGDVDYVFDTGYYPPVDAWTHLAATRHSDGQLNIYLNGSLLSHWSSTPAPTTICYQDLTIGASWKRTHGISELVAFFPGMIDDVRIYNRALTDDEIYDLYVVPISGSVILGSIGLVYVGWKLRK